MREVTLAGHRVMLYTSIEELPMARFHKYNKNLLIDAGIGGDMTAFDGHIERAVQFIKDGKREDAGKELQNLRQNVYMVISETNPNHLSFACLVKEIDGKPMDDMSDEGLQRVVAMLGDVPVNELMTERESVKKKIDSELTAYFPALFDDAKTKEFYDIIKARTQAVLKSVIEGVTDELTKDIERLTGALLTYSKPLSFAGTGNAEVEYDKRYEDMCLVISQNVHRDAKTFTVMEFYNAYLFMERQNKREKRQNKAH